MKRKMFLGLIIVVLAGTIFAEEIPTELQAYVLSKIGADAQLTSLFPATKEAWDKLIELRQGGRPDIICVEWPIGPSTKPIPASLVEMQKQHARVSLTVSINAYVRGEIFLLGFNEDMASKIATEVSASIVFAEILKNSREEIRLEYSWKNPDGSQGYGLTFFLAVDKSTIDQEIANKTAEAAASGKKSDDRRADTGSPAKKPADAKRISEAVNAESSDDLVKSVKTLMDGDSRIQRYREENRQILSFEN